MDSDATVVGESIQQLFYYYMFYLRAQENDSKNTTPGIRNFYAGQDKKFSRLYDDKLMDALSDDIVKERIEHLGNKLPFEKNLNIVAGNGYFDKKKGQYEKSGIAITRNMAHVETSEWDMDSITADPEKVQHILTRFEERVNLFPEKQIFCDNFS